MKDEANVKQDEAVGESLISRRKMLASLSIAGVAIAAGTLLPGGMGTAHADVLKGKAHADVLNDSVADIPALLAYSRGTNTCVIVADPLRGGIFSWSSTGTPNGGTVFAASGGGVWNRQFSGAFNVCWFGAKSLTDSTAAIQAAFNAITRPGCVFFPAGDYYISAQIIIPTQVVSVRGEGQYVTYIRARTNGSILHAMFLGTNADTMEFNSISLAGEGNADSAIFYNNINHSAFINLFITGTGVVAIHINGWNNKFQNCQIVANAGNGIEAFGTPYYNNNLTVLCCEIYANGGIGMRVGNGMNVTISSSTLEHNKVAAIIAYDIQNINIVDSYFERNAQVGFNYTDAQNVTPINIKSDIHLLGGGATIIGIDPSKPVECAKISGIEWSPLNSAGVDNGGINNTSFVFSNYLDKVTIENVHCFDTSKTDSLLTIWGNGLTSIVKGYVSIRGNSKSDVQLIGVDNGVAVSGGHLIEISNTRSKNYYNPNFIDYQRMAETYLGNLLKSQERLSDYPSFELTEGNEWWGSFVDVATKFPELKGKLIWFGAWVKAATGNDVKIVTYDGVAPHGDTIAAAGTGKWQYKSILIPVPSNATSLACAFQKLGSGSKANVAFPVMALVGSSLDRFEIGSEVDFRSTSYPTTGYWEQDDVVRNSAPSAGGVMGWVCTAAGSPGTWKGFGKIDI
ncbi:right-handed parallel beta-helix repeat-containing protein [Paenibacillus baekrokdamisoli]|nr:right-handed parallel beta-helix repeat-containing protein [Paenibacillus baekrokdamisoli]